MVSVDSERWERVKEMLHRIQAVPPEGRAALLQEVSEVDAERGRELELLLRALEKSNSVESLAGAVRSRPHDLEGQLAGPYVLIRHVGSGSTGSVYLASRADDEVRRRVAVKLVHPELFGDDMIQRFRQERQKLAVLDHPNIVKFNDAGAQNDVPFLVTDYISGVSIDVYCKRNALSVDERLYLFRTLCSAVHYGHQHLIAHRNLKPSNVLVTPDGEPKVLDFGLAKLLKPEMYLPSMNLANSGLRLVSPEYASPEQIVGEPITIASDVYSLAIILYELLTGRHPYDFKGGSAAEIEEAVCQVEPQKPSQAVMAAPPGESPEPGAAAISKQLHGDLDAIVLKALEKNPQRRYASVEQFSEDIRCYLHGLPVLAHPYTVGYRAEKFVMRHQLGVVILTAMVSGMLAWMACTGWVAVRSTRDQMRAEWRFSQAHNLAHWMVFDFPEQLQWVTAARQARKNLATRSIQYLDALSSANGLDPSLQLEIADGYVKVGGVQGDPSVPGNLGDEASALASYRKAERLSRPLAEANPHNRDVQQAAARESAKMGRMMLLTGETREGIATLRNAISKLEVLAKGEPPSSSIRFDLAFACFQLGDGLTKSSEWSAGVESHRKALTLFQDWAAAEPYNDEARRAVMVSLGRVADWMAETGDQAGALREYSEMLAATEALAKDHPSDINYQESVAILHRKMGVLLARQGEEVDAIQHARRALGMYESLLGKDPNNNALKTGLSDVAGDLASMLTAQGHAAQARPFGLRVLEIRKERADRPNATAAALNDYASALIKVQPPALRDPAQAESYSQRAVELSGGMNPAILDTLAAAQFLTRQVAAAVDTERKALAALEPAQPGKPTSAQRKEMEAHLATFQGSRK